MQIQFLSKRRTKNGLRGRRLGGDVTASWAQLAGSGKEVRCQVQRGGIRLCFSLHSSWSSVCVSQQSFSSCSVWR